MPLPDPESKIRSEQATLRVLIVAVAAVLTFGMADLAVSNIGYSLSQPPIAPDLPAGQIQVKGDRPQRFEFIDANGRVITSIVVQP